MAVRPQGHGRRPAPDALRAAGVPGRQPALPAAAESGPGHLRADRQSERPERGRARLGRVPVRVHHLPADRAPHRGELQPEMFCEVAPELAAERGLEPYGWATIISPRSAIEARVLVTERMTPLIISGQVVHQIGLPYHWGGGKVAVVTGDAANDLLGVTLDPNVQIQESKA